MRDTWYALSWMLMLPLTIMSAHVGVVLWIWVAMLSPSELLYGALAGVPFNKIVAIATVITLIISRDKKDYYVDGLLALVIAFGILATVSWLTGIVPNDDATSLYQKLLKELVLVFAIAAITVTRPRIHQTLLIIVLSIGFFSVREGLIFALTAGGHKIQGSGSFGDNNGMAAAVLMIVPILYYLNQYSALKAVRFGLMAGLVLSIICVIGTYSRGGFVGLVVLGLFLAKNSRNKVTTLTMLILGAGLVYTLAPATWFDRLNTINSVGDDGSFMGRVVAWKISLLIALDHPLTGGGPHAVHRLFVWETYRPFLHLVDFVKTPPADTLPHAAHSIWFEILGDLGFTGLAVFVSILATSFWYCRSIVRMTRGHPSLVWASDLARMLQISLVVYVVTGSALSLGYYELLYIIVALLSRLRRTVRQILSAAEPSVVAVRSGPIRAPVPRPAMAEFANPARSFDDPATAATLRRPQPW